MRLAELVSVNLSILFPEPIDKVVSIPSNVFYQLLLRTKFCPGLKRESEVTVEPLLTFGPHGMVSSDPERHRRIALKALNERFAKAGVSSRAQNEVIEWPSLIDPDDTQKTDNNKSDESSVIIELPTITNPSSTDTLNTLNSSNVRIALKALNERFAKAGVSSRAQNEVIEWSSLIDPDDTQKTDNNKSDESSVIIELPTITNPSSTDTLNTLNSSNV
uniref:Transmembrane protein 115 n=1 Tax=Schistosoma haematobium TaxID=6185 RepID=A0A095B3P6_SCHHA